MKTLRTLLSAISTLLVITVVALAILLVGVRLVGLTPYTVLSGSMEPAYHVGSLIYVRPIDAQDIEVGTPLTFTVSDGSLVATHRVVEIITENGETLYITKGDANDVTDPPLKYSRVIGSPVFSIPFLGYFSTWLQSGAGVIAGIALAAMLLLTSLLTELLPSDGKPAQPLPEVEAPADAPDSQRNAANTPGSEDE
jgi:signal peptidase